MVLVFPLLSLFGKMIVIDKIAIMDMRVTLHIKERIIFFETFLDLLIRRLLLSFREQTITFSADDTLTSLSVLDLPQ